MTCETSQFDVAEVRRFLDARDRAVAMPAGHPGYPAARRQWLAAERAVRPLLDCGGIRAGGRLVRVDGCGEVVVATLGKVSVRAKGHAPRTLKIASPERADRIGGRAC